LVPGWRQGAAKTGPGDSSERSMDSVIGRC
jgi:hypothetical protein